MMDSKVADNSGRHSFSSAVGKGSKSHDFDDDRRMIASTSSIVAEGNSVSGNPAKGLSRYNESIVLEALLILFSVVLTLLTFSLKNLLNASETLTFIERL